MAQINGIEVKNFNPNAKTYNLKLADSGAADENKNYKLAKQLEEIGLKEQRRVNALTKERKIWEKKAAQTPEGQKKEQKKFANEQKLAGQEKTKNRIRKKIKAAFFPPICPKR